MTENGPKKLVEGQLVDFHYQKSTQYRTVHCDGIYGGGTPRGYIAVTFLSERPPIPKMAQRQTISSSDSEFTLGPEKIVDSLDGIVRTLEVTTMLDLRTAKELNEWLGEHITALESAIQNSDMQNTKVRKAKGESAK